MTRRRLGYPRAMGKVELTFETDAELVERAAKSGIDLAAMAALAIPAYRTLA